VVPTLTEENKGGPAHRLTLRAIIGDLATRFFSLERGWLCTVKELCTEPGPMIRRYIEGERLVYANPFAYLLVATAISVLVQSTIGFQEWILADTLNNPELSPQLAAFTRDVQELIFKQLLYVGLSILIPFAVFLRLFFRRSGFNLAEMLVFTLYTGGHMLLAGVVLLPVARLFSLHPAILGGPVTLAYLGYAAVGLFGGRVITVFKTVAAYLFGLCCTMITAIVLVVVYVLWFGTSFRAADDRWNLISSTEQGSAAIVESLIEQGDDVNMTLLRTPLHVAADQGALEIVDLLLGGGANVNARDYLGQVPLFHAIRKGHLEIAWRLIEAGTEPPSITESGYTLLMVAARSDDTQLVQWLLDNGSPVNAVRPEGKRVTALMAAAHEGAEAVVQLLLEHGADPSIENDEGKTALDYADTDAIEEMLRTAVTAHRETDSDPPAQ